MARDHAEVYLQVDRSVIACLASDILHVLLSKATCGVVVACQWDPCHDACEKTKEENSTVCAFQNRSDQRYESACNVRLRC